MATPSAIKLDQQPTTADRRVLVLTGTNTTDIQTIVVAGVPATVVQPTKTTWRAELRLAAGDNVITLSGIDLGGNPTPALRFTIAVGDLEQRQHLTFNVFDEFGLLLSLPRLPGEKNVPYRARLRDVELHPADTTLRGVTFGTSRELGVRILPALTLASPLDGSLGQPRAIDGQFRVVSIFLELRSSRFLTRECHKVEPATQSVRLDRRPVGVEALRVTTLEGDPIAPALYEVDLRRREVRFLTHKLNDVDLYFSFLYVERFNLRNRTLAELKTDVEALVDSDGQSLFSVSLLGDSTIPTENLVPIPTYLPVTDTPFTLEATSIRVRELLDEDYQDANLNARGHAIGTKLQAWADRINNETRILWSSAFLGESLWEPLGEEPKLGALPHLADAERGYWRCLLPTDSTRYTRKDFRRTGGVCPNDGALLVYVGIRPNQFQSGTGTRDDLKVIEIVSVQEG